MYRNEAGQSVRVFAFNAATGLPYEGDAANITCKISKDGGPLVGLADANPVEQEDGYYLFDLTQAETNADTIDLFPGSSTAGIVVLVPNHDRRTAVRLTATTISGSGTISIGGAWFARYAAMNPETTLSDAQIATSLAVAIAIAEGITGLTFGSDVTGVIGTSPTYRLAVASGTFEVGQSVRLIGGGVPATLFEITDIGPGWIEVESDTAIAPTRVLPSYVYVGEAASGHVRVDKRPLFSVVSVKTKRSSDMLWSDPNVTTLASTQYETFANSGLKAGVFIPASSIPRVSEGGQYLVKRMQRQAIDGIRVEYVAGFYWQIPADLEAAIMSLVSPIAAALSGSGVFASENHDYYSYTVLTYDQLAVLPYAAMTILKRYARL